MKETKNLPPLLSIEEAHQKGLWFMSKRYGWGWMPITWQGWLTIFAYAFLVAKDVMSTLKYDQTFSHSAADTLLQIVPSFILLTILVLFIMYEKGEEPHWRWGK